MKTVYIKTLSAVPSLSRAGFITEPKAIVKRLFDYYILSLYSQTNTYYGTITSLAYSLKEGGDDMYAVSSYIERTLGEYYKRYFKTVEISVRETRGNLGTKATIELLMTVGDGDQSISLNDAINVTEGVIDLSNYGNTTKR